MSAQRFPDRLRRFFFMRQALAEADQRTSSMAPVCVASCRAAGSLLAAAESLEDVREWQLSAVTLLRHAVVYAGLGLAAERRLAAGDADASTAWTRVVGLPELQAVTQAQSARAREQLSRIIGSGITPELANWSTDELLALKQSLLAVARCLVSLFEADVSAPRRLRRQRALRWLSLGIILSLLVGYVVYGAFLRKAEVNLALNRTVLVSSNADPRIHPATSLVDGDRTKLGCRTLLENKPWVLIDLGHLKTINHIVITNQLDRHSERAIPLLIETSADDLIYREFARQTDDFETWDATAVPIKARYVRSTILGTSSLRLNEVAIY